MDKFLRPVGSKRAELERRDFRVTLLENGNKDFESGTPGRGLQRTVNKE